MLRDTVIAAQKNQIHPVKGLAAEPSNTNTKSDHVQPDLLRDLPPGGGRQTFLRLLSPPGETVEPPLIVQLPPAFFHPA